MGMLLAGCACKACAGGIHSREAGSGLTREFGSSRWRTHWIVYDPDSFDFSAAGTTFGWRHYLRAAQRARRVR